MEITKQTTMGEMLEYDRGIAYVLMQSGMHCVGCPSSIGESLEQACDVYGLDAARYYSQLWITSPPKMLIDKALLNKAKERFHRGTDGGALFYPINDYEHGGSKGVHNVIVSNLRSG